MDLTDRTGEGNRSSHSRSSSEPSSAAPTPDERFERLLDAMEAQTGLMRRYLHKLESTDPQESEKRQILCDYYTTSSYNTTVVIAALIITCCFTALLQPPGGMASQSGKATLERSATFKVFFALNGMAMGTACVTILLLMGGRPVTARGANILLLLGRSLVSFAIHFTLGAFLAGAFIVTEQVPVLVSVLVLCGVALTCYYALYSCQHEILDRFPLPPSLERNLSSKFMISLGRRL